MKKTVHLFVTGLIVLYILCFIDMNGTENLPNIDEYIQFLVYKKDQATELLRELASYLFTG